MDENNFSEPMVFPIEDTIDLHTFQPREVKDLLHDYLEAAWEKGFREVRIIHGQGTGTLARLVHKTLDKHPLVQSYSWAPRERGGWGATMVCLQEDEP